MKQKTFLNYLLVSIISFLIDISIFFLANFIIKPYLPQNYILISTIISRLISSFINYLLNRNTVFKNNHNTIDLKTLIKYYLLVTIQMLISASLVTIIYNLLTISETLIKIAVDLILFMINYLIQKHLIFKKYI